MPITFAALRSSTDRLLKLIFDLSFQILIYLGFKTVDTGSSRNDHVFTFTVSPTKAKETRTTNTDPASSSSTATTSSSSQKSQIPVQHANMDQSLLNDFLAGDHCLRGGMY